VYTPHLGFTEVGCTSVKVIATGGEPHANSGTACVVVCTQLVVVTRNGREGVVTSGTRDASFFCAWIVIIAVDRVSNAHSTLTKLRVRTGVAVVAGGEGRSKEAAHL